MPIFHHLPQPTAPLLSSCCSPSTRNEGGKGFFQRVWAKSGFEEFESLSPSLSAETGGHPAPTRDGTEPPPPCTGPGTPSQTLENLWAGEKPSALLLPGQAGGEGPTCQGGATGGDVFVEINHRGEQCGRAGSGLRAAPSRRLNIYLSRSCLPVMDRRFQGGAGFCSSTEPGLARCPEGDGATNRAAPWGHRLRLP